MEKKIKIYGFNNNGEYSGLSIAVAIGEDGQMLASHMCSDESFMPYDLGMSKGATRKHDIYNTIYGEGKWETEFVSSKDRDSHKGLQKALFINGGK